MSIYEHYYSERHDEEGHLLGIDLEYPNNFNFGFDVVDELARITPDKTAIVWCDSEGSTCKFTFADVSEQSNKVANALKRAGIKKGMRVMLCLKRHYEYWFCLIALHKLGILTIPVTHMLTVGDFAYRIRASRPDAILCTPNDHVPEKVLEAAKSACPACKLWSIQQDVEGFVNLTAEAEKESPFLDRIDTSVEDSMIMYFTSGTTGNPKGVIHDFTYPLAHIITAKCWQGAEDGGLHFTVAETGWAKASWGKVYGQWFLGSAVMVYDFDVFDPKKLCDIVNQYRVTSLCAPPTVYRYLARKGIPQMPSLKHASAAGEVLAPEVSRIFLESTGVPLREGYGQSETALLTANFDDSSPTPGSMGTASPLYNIDLQDQNGSAVPDGTVGEVVIVPPRRGRQVGVFSSYLDAENQYEQAWRGGVYHTGDAAYKDGQGRFWFMGRLDDVIKTSGFRVGPSEVESALMEHPAVLECSVVGVPDKLRGQSIKAFVALCDGFSPSKELELSIKELSNSKLAEYKRIRLLEFVESMPMTASGKIRKKNLAANRSGM